jgi:hypothetical protein
MGMIDVETRQKLKVHTEGDAGPYIIVPVSQLEVVKDLLKRHQVAFSTDDYLISVDGKPEVTLVNLGTGTDAQRVQRILDDAA